MKTFLLDASNRSSDQPVYPCSKLGTFVSAINVTSKVFKILDSLYLSESHNFFNSVY